MPPVAQWKTGEEQLQLDKKLNLCFQKLVSGFEPISGDGRERRHHCHPMHWRAMEGREGTIVESGKRRD